MGNSRKILVFGILLHAISMQVSAQSSQYEDPNKYRACLQTAWRDNVMTYTNHCSVQISVAAVYADGSGSGLQYVNPGRTILTGNWASEVRQHGHVITAVCPGDSYIEAQGGGDWRGGAFRCRK